jgi:hypothetical protein
MEDTMHSVTVHLPAELHRVLSYEAERRGIEVGELIVIALGALSIVPEDELPCEETSTLSRCSSAIAGTAPHSEE